MVQPGIIQHLIETFHSPALGIRGAIDEALHAGVEHGAGAHEARFEGDVEGGAGQAVVCAAPGSIAQGDDFGVGSGIVGGYGLVP